MAIILSETWTHGLLLMPSLHVSQPWHSHLIRLGATAASRPLGHLGTWRPQMGAKSGQDELCGSYYSTQVFFDAIPTSMPGLGVKA